MAKKIGFHLPDIEEDQVKPASDIDEVIHLLRQSYQTFGDTPQKELLSTLELCYEYSEIMEIRPSLMSKALQKEGYQHKFVEGLPLWILYQRID